MKTEQIHNKIKEMFTNLGFEVNGIVVDEVIGKDGSASTWFRVSLDDAHPFLHKDANGLLSFTHLIKRVLENEIENKEQVDNILNKIVIDINDFQKRKVESIHAVAHMMAERARYFKSNIEVDPMSAFERRIVHEFLSGEDDLKTESSGFGPNRRVVIKYIGN